MVVTKQRWAWAAFVPMLFMSVPGMAQSADPDELRHVRWPLLDMVIVSDSSACVWLMVAPNPATKEWEAGTPLISLTLDPVQALQWATFARGLMGNEDSHGMPNAVDRRTPFLRTKHGPAFLVLVRNRRNRRLEETFLLAVSDSASNTRWKTFASPGQVDTLLIALEHTATRSWAMAPASDSSSPAEPEDVEIPVRILSIPRLKYPPQLSSKGRIGRVWMTYWVGINGRAEEGSLRPLLSDDPLFTRAAIEALRHGKYQPARRRGQPVRHRVFQVVTFRMP
jgi:hypothetical protein